MTTPQLIARPVAALLVLLMSVMVSAQQAPPFDGLIGFGDSLMDNGNIFVQSRLLGADPLIPPPGAYFEGRFSDGPVGLEYLWETLRIENPSLVAGVQPFMKTLRVRQGGALNFAFGGTGTPVVDLTPAGTSAPGLKGQVELFRLALLGRKASSNTLYVISTGANDYRNDPFNVPMAPAAVVRNIEDAIVSLYRLGARHVMVLDLPDLGLIPGNGGDPAATAISIEHNTKLYAMLGKLQKRFPSLHLVTVKLNPLFLNLLNTMPGGPFPALGALVSEGAATCLFFDPASCPTVPYLFDLNLGFLFWDVVHPTTEAHRHLGELMHTELVNSYD